MADSNEQKAALLRAETRFARLRDEGRVEGLKPSRFTRVFVANLIEVADMLVLFDAEPGSPTDEAYQPLRAFAFDALAEIERLQRRVVELSSE